MKHFLIVVIVGVVTLSVMLILYRPEVLEDIWLWVVGLIGPAVGLIQFIAESVQAFLKKININSYSNET
ncbi:MAG: hypothetical protein JXR07_14940 [Reichenbachiella sp.]